MRHLVIHAIGCGMLLLVGSMVPAQVPAQVQAQSTLDNAPATHSKVILDSESIEYTNNGNTVIAHGEVQLTYQSYRLLTDRLTWYRHTDELLAEGQSQLFLPDGTVISGERIALRNHLQEGTLAAVSTRFRQTAAFLFANAGRRDGNKYTLYQTFYTPCECDKVIIGKGRPLWNIRSWRSRLDRDAGLIEHWHAILQIKGMPIAYVPYFSYVSPEIDRKTGLLGPSYEHSKRMGYNFAQPIFFNLAPHYDITLTPRYASKSGYIQEAHWRHLLPHGEYEVFGVGTFPKSRFKRQTGQGQSFRGSLLGQGDFHVDTIDYGFKVQGVTDKNFFIDYKQREYEVLENQVYFQNVSDNSFVRADAIAYGTTILTQRNATRPRILPWVQASHTLPQLFLGGTVRVHSDIIHIFREIGDDVVRASAGFAWQRNFYWQGLKLTPYTSGRTDIYDYRFDEPESKKAERRADFTKWRNFATFATRLSYPLVNYTRLGTYIVEPVAQATYTVGPAYHDRIVDEDGQVTELSADNLFDYDRFSGKDREETGLRVAYGIRTQAQWARGSAQFSFGQSWQGNPHQAYGRGSGLAQERSDYVATALLSFDGLSARHNMRLSSHDFNTRRHETSVKYSNQFGSLVLGHIIADRVLTSDIRERQGFGRARLNLGKYAAVQGDMVYDFQNERRFTSRISVHYGDECVRFFVAYARNHTARRGQDDKSISFGITLKTLSSVGSSTVRSLPSTVRALP